MNPGHRQILVLGVGNTLMGDEGVGVRVVEALRASFPDLPTDVSLVDGGTLGLDLLPLVDDAGALLMIDAVQMNASAGSIIVLRGDELRAQLGGKMSAHQVGVGDLLAVARLRGTLPALTSLIGIQPESLEIGLDLSGPVAGALPEAVRLARAEISAFAAG